MTETTTTDTTPRAVSPARRNADTIFTWLAALTALDILVQVFLAGVGAFGDHARKVEDATSFDPHRFNGEIVAGLTLLMLIAALVARASKFQIWGSVVVFLLAEVAQHGLASGGDSNKWVGGLHAFDGILILLLVIGLHVTSRRRIGASPTT